MSRDIQRWETQADTSLLFSIRFFGKVKAQLIGATQARASRDTAVRVRLGRTLATLQDLLLMIMTLDHSVPLD